MHPASQTQPELVFKNTIRLAKSKKRTFGNSFYGLFQKKKEKRSFKIGGVS